MNEEPQTALVNELIRRGVPEDMRKKVGEDIAVLVGQLATARLINMVDDQKIQMLLPILGATPSNPELLIANLKQILEESLTPEAIETVYRQTSDEVITKYLADLSQK